MAIVRTLTYPPLVSKWWYGGGPRGGERGTEKKDEGETEEMEEEWGRGGKGTGR